MRGNKFTQVTSRLALVVLGLVLPAFVGGYLLPDSAKVDAPLYFLYAAQFWIGLFVLAFGGAIVGSILHILYYVLHWVWTGERAL